MSLICLFGPHAIGKTTAARRWVDRYKPRLKAALADAQLVYDGEAEVRVREWKGTLEEKHRLIGESRADPSSVILIESCSSYGHQIARGLGPADRVIHVYCPPALLRENLRRRCEASGKTFNLSYWDDKRCGYEAFQRMDNCLRRVLRPDQYVKFLIKDYAADWPAVDEYFSQLFRRLYNDKVRKGKQDAS